MAPAPQQEASPKLRVLESAVVAPWPIPPVPETSLPLTFFDVFWLNFPPVERVFFYHLVPGPGAATILSNLKTSLSQALRAFYPLAGRLRLRPGTTDRHELHYQPGDGVTFTVAMYDLDVDELALDGPREVAKIAQLVPPLPDGGAVLALQATVLRSNTGGGRDGLGQGEEVRRDMLGGDHRQVLGQDDDGEHSGGAAQHEEGARVRQDGERRDPQAMVHCSSPLTEGIYDRTLFVITDHPLCTIGVPSVTYVVFGQSCSSVCSTRRR